MTFKDFAIEFLTSNGMFDDQASAVFEIVKTDPANEAMRDRWNDDVSEYPAMMQTLTRMSAKRAALSYIDEHCPQAWFRPMFTDDPEAELARLKAAK